MVRQTNSGQQSALCLVAHKWQQSELTEEPSPAGIEFPTVHSTKWSQNQNLGMKFCPPSEERVWGSSREGPGTNPG